MTAILGYISADSKSMFLASDGLVIWHTDQGDNPQNNYKKICKFQNFLISFNGEVEFFQTFLCFLKKINKDISSISELQNAINDVFPFDKFGNNYNGHSKAKYSNVIILDIENRVLAHHFAGCVSGLNYYSPFDFQVLEKNNLYHFGSKVSFMNDASLGNTEDAFSTENHDFLKQTITEQIKAWEDILHTANQMYRGVGQLNSYYIDFQNKIKHNELDTS